MNKSTSTRLGQILLDKGLVTAEQLDIAIKEQQKRRQLLDPFDENLGVNSSLGEILIEMGFIDRLQLKRGLNWQLMLRKMAIVMSFCAPLMAVSAGAAAGNNFRPTFTAESSSSAAKVNPSFTKTSSSSSSTRAVVNTVSSASSRSSSSKSSVVNLASSSKSSTPSNQDKTAPKMPEISVVAADHNHVQLKWSAPSSESGIAYYKIYRDQVEVDVIDLLDGYRLDFDDYSVSADKAYLYGISAGDSAGNWSPVKSIFVQTGAAPLDNGSGYPSSSSSAASSEESSSVEPPVVTSSSSVKSATSSAASSANNSSKAVSSTASSASSAAVSSSKSSAKFSSVASSSPSSAKSSVASSSSSAGAPKNSLVAGPVSLNWSAPTLRENGNALDITEVGGYELRYRKVADVNFTYVTINDAWKNSHNFSWLEGTYLFQVAAFDKHGVYSNFVDLTPH